MLWLEQSMKGINMMQSKECIAKNIHSCILDAQLVFCVGLIDNDGIILMYLGYYYLYHNELGYR